MNKDRFIKLIETYGTSPSRWPDDIRSAAQAYADSNPDAAALLEHQGTVDAFLDHADSTPTISSDALSRILDIPNKHQQFSAGKGLMAWLRSLDLDASFIMPRLAGMAAAAVLGFYMGTTDLLFLSQDEPTPETIDLSDLVFDTFSGEYTP